MPQHERLMPAPMVPPWARLMGIFRSYGLAKAERTRLHEPGGEELRYVPAVLHGHEAVALVGALEWTPERTTELEDWLPIRWPR